MKDQSMNKIKIVLIVTSLLLTAQVWGISSTTAQHNRDIFVDEAKSKIGCPYSLGSEGPNYFDCSGLIMYCAKQMLNINLPRNSRAQYEYCAAIEEKDREVGDLVFFKTGHSWVINHVGIYIGDNKFISALSAGPKTGVQIADLNKQYWVDSFAGYRRFLPSGKDSNSSKYDDYEYNKWDEDDEAYDWYYDEEDDYSYWDNKDLYGGYSSPSNKTSNDKDDDYDFIDDDYSSGAYWDDNESIYGGNHNNHNKKDEKKKEEEKKEKEKSGSVYGSSSIYSSNTSSHKETYVAEKSEKKKLDDCIFVIDITGLFDFSTFKLKKEYHPYDANPNAITSSFGFDVRGGTGIVNIGIGNVPLFAPGVAVGVRYNNAMSCFQFPLVATLSFGEYFRVYGGLALTKGETRMPNINYPFKTELKNWTFGASLSTPRLDFGNVGVQLVQDISYTDFAVNGKSFSLSYPENIYAGLMFETGLRVTFGLI